jgi:hypothetical protein
MDLRGFSVKKTALPATLIVMLLLSMLLVGVIPTAMAQQTSDSTTASSTGTPETFVEVVGVDTSIAFGTFAIATQTNTRSAAGVNYVIFESENEATTPPDSATLDEGATNANAFYYITYTGETYPATGGLDNTNWIYFMDTANTLDTYGYYVNSQITGTLSLGGGGITDADGVTAGTQITAGVDEVGSYSATLTVWSSTDGTTWTMSTQTIYVALGTDNKLYVDDDANLDPTQTDSTQVETITAKGDQVTNAFKGNKFVLTSAFPTAAGQTATFDFGWYIPWDSTQGDDDKSFYVLVDVPKHAAANHQWTWTITMHGEYHSDA